ncbi:MAG: LamG-like jellyroll fold domain-containing protein, partial [Anaerolineae bacterium]
PGACGGSLECITPPSGLAAWWPGDSDANDISGNNNHAQLRNGAQAGEPGKVAGAFKFDGVDDVADTAMALPSKGTLELWVNPFSLSGDHGIIGTFGKANGDDRLWIKVTGPDGGIGGPNRLRVNLGSCCVADFDTPSPLVRGVWTHLALTFDYVSDSYDLYVDGQAVASSTASREAPTEALSFGGLRSTWGESLFFDGLEDEISLYSRVLTPGEIQAIFNAGSAGKCKVTTHGLTATTGLRVPAASTVLTDGPTLVIPDQVPASPSGSVAVPVEFTSNGHSIASTVFSVDYDETLLTFNPGDSDHDGLPDTITLYLPSAFSASVTLDGNDTDGELDILIADTLPPLASLPDGTITTITLDAVNRPSNATTAAVTFSQDPAASFGNTSGQSVPGTSNGGSVLIRCPDCIRFLPMIMVRAQ